MPHQLDPSLVFVLRGETPVGMGFLISTELIITCAHVVCQALGWSLETDQPAPDTMISLRFVFHEKQAKCLAVIAEWIPYSDQKLTIDHK